MRVSMLKALSVNDSCMFGTWVKLASPETLECLAIVGFDFVVIDMEHAPHTFASVYQGIVLGQALGMNVLVRLPDGQGASVQRVLDSGADGVLVPRVRSAAEARSVISDMMFSPRGGRGMGITSRAGQWGLASKEAYFDSGDTQTFRGMQLEDAEALASADSILDVAGVNALFVGPGDLALATGKPPTHPDNAPLVDGLLSTAKARGIPCGTAVGDAAAALEAKKRGFRFVMISNDATMFAKAAAGIMQGLRE